MSKYEIGMKMLEENHKNNTGGKILNDLKEICPDFVKYVAEFGMAEFMNRPHLDQKMREFLIIALCIGQGAYLQARAHMEVALRIGATKEELSEVILQTIPLTGFPHATNAFLSLKEVLENQK